MRFVEENQKSKWKAMEELINTYDEDKRLNVYNLLWKYKGYQTSLDLAKVKRKALTNTKSNGGKGGKGGRRPNVVYKSLDFDSF